MGDEVYDISPKQREITDFRYARRLKLRNEYWRELQNPIKQGIPSDSYARLGATRLYLGQYHTPNFRSFASSIGITLFLIGSTLAWIQYDRKKKTELIYSNKLLYRDRRRYHFLSDAYEL